MSNSESLHFFINNQNTSFSNSNDNLIYLKDSQKESNIDLEINNIGNNIILNNPFISINSKNIFTKISQNYINGLNKKFKKIYFQNDESLSKLNKLSNIIKENLLEHLYPKIGYDFFQISLEISKLMKKKEFLKKENLEKNIEYFFNSRIYYKYTKYLKIDKQFINNCGPILCNIYNNLDTYKIKDNNSFIKVIDDIKSNNKINVLNDFLFHCNNNDLKPEFTEKYKFLKSNKKKYIFEPEFIFLMNILQLVTKVFIDFDFEGEILSINELHLYYIVILNINYLLKNLKSVKFNLINRNFQFGAYGVNTQKLLKESKYNLFFKKNFSSINKFIYNEKWDFENDFALENYKLLKTIKNFYFENIKIPNLYYLNSEENNFKNKNKSKNLIKDTDNGIIIDFLSFDNIDLNNKSRRKTFTNTQNNILLMKDNEQKVINKQNEFEFLIDFYIKNIINKCCNVLEMIFISLDSLKYIINLEEIELIFNESYYYEFQSFCRNECQIDIGNSHILDYIYHKLINMNLLSFEINSFDLITFNRILKILYNNDNLLSLKFSFFSSDCTYYPQSIFKLFNQNLKNKILKINKFEYEKGLSFKLEEKFYKTIYPYFQKYLNYFLEILKSKKLKELGLNFDAPPPILNDEKYVITIFKFILNIILLCMDNIDSCVEKLIILSPSLVINGNIILFFDKFLKNIHNKNICLENLSLQIKFYNIINIHKLISQKLKILNIGDFDLVSLKHFVDNISKYNFCKSSSLEQISVSINKTIIKLNDEIKILIAKLFYIKIINLSLINLYTNIEINKKEEFEEILGIICDNWISSYLFILNDKSKNIIENYLKKYIYLSYITRRIKTKNKDNIIYIDSEITDKIFLYLKIMFNKKCKKLDFLSKKKIISKILKFLYISARPTYNFFIENK